MDEVKRRKLSPLYLDYLATTPVCRESSQAMLDLLSKDVLDPLGAWGNPGSSHHEYGQVAKRELEYARSTIARVLNAQFADEICFESGSTESINHALRGIFASAHYCIERGHLVTSEIEHPAVFETVKSIPGVESTTFVAPDEYGVVDPQTVAQACRAHRTRLVSIMMVNNEVGSIMNIQEMVRLVKRVDPNIIFHCDASQAVGKTPVDVQKLGVDLLTVAGHKLYAPKGTGCLFIKRGVHIDSLITGAGHEDHRRAGTENVLLNVAFARAMETISEAENTRIASLRNLLYAKLVIALGGGDVCRRNGPLNQDAVIPHCLSISFSSSKVVGNQVAKRCWDEFQVAFSAGAACHSGEAVVPSRVLTSMKMERNRALSTIRLSVGRFTTEDDVERAAQAIAQVVLDG